MNEKIYRIEPQIDEINNNLKDEDSICSFGPINGVLSFQHQAQTQQ